ncbi:pex2/pex10/pex12 family protein [Sporobolomyces koalae]|uniref:pex2/pex10/pex12 family protein n=1 Tax=Sporobolomyces koalae TaxID=500713 RepID=UPI00316BBF76
MSAVGSSADLERYWVAASSASVASVPAIRNSLGRFPSAPLRISRVAQLDASLLDHELEGILHAPVKSALEGVSTPGRTSWEPEVLALLRLAVLKMSLWDTASSYGSSLQNLRYRNEGKHSRQGLQSTAVDSSLTRTQKLLYTALFVLPPYLHVRLQDTMLASSWSDEPLPRSWGSLVDVRRLFVPRPRRQEELIQWKREWKRSLWELMGVGEKLGAVAALANFLVFLYNGRYRTLVDRVLKMRLVYAQRSASPNVSFEYLNRQLVWEAFTEFLLFLLPLIKLRRLRLRLSKSIIARTNRSKTLRALATSLPAPVALTLGLSSLTPSSSSPASSEKSRQGVLHFLPTSTCAICYQLANSPPTRLPSSSGSIADPTNPSNSLVNTSASQHYSAASASNSDTTVKIPYVANCAGRCRYCYYCIVGTLATCEEEAEDSWECLRCRGPITAADREPELLEDSDREE